LIHHSPFSYRETCHPDKLITKAADFVIEYEFALDRFAFSGIKKSIR